MKGMDNLTIRFHGFFFDACTWYYAYVYLNVCVKEIYESCTRMSNKQHQFCGLLGLETMFFVHMQKLIRGTYSNSTMIIEAERSTRTFLQFCPTTWCHICAGHNYYPTARTRAFRTLCRQSQLTKTLLETKISYSYSGSQISQAPRTQGE